MCSLFRRVVIVLLCFAASGVSSASTLRVCADPDNLPFSNQHRQGFENRIATLLARDMHAQLAYVWQRMGRGFVREYLSSGRCDLLVGIPIGFKSVLTTAPYYRSTYVFVSRRSAVARPTSLNDLDLHAMRIGVQVLDDDYAPPARALARRGMQNNIVGFDTTGADAGSIIRAVANRKVDTALVWGPLAGYFAQRYGANLILTPVQPEVDPPGLPFTFAIAMGVRKGNTQLRDRLQAFLDRRRPLIEAILHQYGVPQIDQHSFREGGN